MYLLQWAISQAYEVPSEKKQNMLTQFYVEIKSTTEKNPVKFLIYDK